ncbi:MAG: hypothetical protein EXR07_17565 [Acetobacteraceae bacterium]|nr:hypothetical protein [Acetobacteraceae bacterium]
MTKNAAKPDKLARQHPAVQARTMRLITQAEKPAKNVSEAIRALNDAPVERASRLLAVLPPLGHEAAARL